MVRCDRGPVGGWIIFEIRTMFAPQSPLVPYGRQRLMLRGPMSDFEIIVASHVANGWTPPARPHPQPIQGQGFIVAHTQSVAMHGGAVK